MTTKAWKRKATRWIPNTMRMRERRRRPGIHSKSQLTFEVDCPFTLIARTSPRLGVEDGIADKAQQLHQRPERPHRALITHSTDRIIHGMVSRTRAIEGDVCTLHATPGASIFVVSIIQSRIIVPGARGSVDGVIRIRANDAPVPGVLRKDISMYMRCRAEMFEDVV